MENAFFEGIFLLTLKMPRRIQGSFQESGKYSPKMPRVERFRIT